jgi:hypothetical protein
VCSGRLIVGEIFLYPGFTRLSWLVDQGQQA